MSRELRGAEGVVHHACHRNGLLVTTGRRQAVDAFLDDARLANGRVFCSCLETRRPMRNDAFEMLEKRRQREV